MICYTSTNGLIRTPRGDFKPDELRIEKCGDDFWVAGREPKFGGNFFTCRQYHICFIEKFDNEPDARARLAEIIEEARRR